MAAVIDPSALRQVLEGMRGQPERLIEIILSQAETIKELRREIQALKDQIKDLSSRNDGLTAKVEALAQKTARQAAPFRIPEQQRRLHPQRPGRKPGHAGFGPGGHAQQTTGHDHAQNLCGLAGNL